MVRSSLIFTALATASTALAQTTAEIKCSLSSHCPESAPCCSQYGACGTGAYCLGGCDPLSSHKLSSCVPAPVCRSQNYDFTSLDRIIPNTKYLGDASKADWVSSGAPVIYNKNVLLTMAPDTVGTLLASSTYMWYGNVKATFKTSRGAGVVTAFILLSDVKDEIDYEFVGVDLKTAQTNYYFQGITNYGNSQNITLSDTFNNYHTYEINWTPDKITWLVDGQEGRTLEKKDTWNATTNQWMYPQTPARVQLSLWPGGLASNAKGTVDWAGGQIDWNGADIKSNGYYYSMFQSVSVKCYDAKTAPGTNSGTSYTYNNAAGTNDTVVDGDSPTVLKSLLGTGENMDAGDPASSKSASGSAAATPTAVAQVPGLTGSGTGSDDHAGDTQPGTSAAPAANNAASSTADAAASTPTAQSNGQFNQGGGASGSSTTASGADKLGSQEKALKGSLFAGVVVLVAMMAL
ncbi:Concanavalin A-like lectins/glucanase [Glarea lozoyensis ATCC 20868]|uniref:Crh-like protein n=1 Tax=Glarea lozoyensis (strain ATCC 20868 / MF5171) TaxID=1116229 RepID=S3EA18_GLAL2|nr:Concanavalin A-like lectins/glucanase [Glarea lozoyensis ATCC 20868]EPE35178.1 Concanavalin A-like lectins/glucanase [Glarea lozoyensis ATCC 20868]